MKIVSIFAGKLYALKYVGQSQNELRRLLAFWQDPQVVYNFLKANTADLPKNKTIFQLAEMIADDAETIEDTLNQLTNDEFNRLEEFFKPLNNLETNIRSLSLQKGREQYLRLYSIKIDDNCFLITGGAIKLTRFMEERSHTADELGKIKQCRDYLGTQGIFDIDSLQEWIKEQ
ncbi:MAG: hypothetical protein H7257_06390 [Taibaiella sp.]|nr:hypothetical protein [Taibaiella sp.]